MEAMLKKGCEWAEGRREKKAIDERYDEMRHDVMNWFREFVPPAFHHQGKKGSYDTYE